ncbi:hypothetical protein [Pseudarthrobacter sulfonivorans]|uniref:hypothetical protein n=1 Tax=Pseudarthrobacter sulfonivorans TaxID=121292 RepID=UPI002786AB9A|nr:hypothetical protein [Pseudarthrobacter sulfonivorans]MDP9998294.1 hypothetical protein [Pseudarthrobacter sulfonivorans]
MTVSVWELFEKSGLQPAGVVKWGDQVPLDRPGVYVVASTPDVSGTFGRSGIYQPDFEALASLRTICPSVTVDGVPATASNYPIESELSGFRNQPSCTSGWPEPQSETASISATELALVNAHLMQVDGGSRP